MEPLAILFVLPALAGVTAEIVFRDARNASIAAVIASILIVCVGLKALGSAETWNWLAAILVLPLPIAFALAAVVVLYGRSHVPRRHRRRDG